MYYSLVVYQQNFIRALFDFLRFKKIKICFIGHSWGWYRDNSGCGNFSYIIREDEDGGLFFYQQGPRLMMRVMRSEPSSFVLLPFDGDLPDAEMIKISSIYLVDCDRGGRYRATDFFYGSRDYILNRFGFSFLGECLIGMMTVAFVFKPKIKKVFDEFKFFIEKNNVAFKIIDLDSYKESIHWEEFRDQAEWNEILGS